MADAAVIYTRVSTTGQMDNYSLGDQLEMSNAYCDQHHYDVVALRQDVYSGHSDEDERPGLAQALHDLEVGAAQVIVVAKGDRLSREDDSPLAYYERIAKRYGARIEYVKPGLLAGTKFAGLGREIESFMNAEERERIKERTTAGMRRRIAAGKYRGVPFPKYGYLLQDGKHILDPETAPIVRRIFEAIAGGKTLNQVAAELTADGVPTVSTTMASRAQYARQPIKAWRPEVLSKLVADTRYYGDLRVGQWHVVRRKVRTKTGVVKMTKKNTPADESTVVHHECPPIVSKELWDAVQQVKANNKARSTRNNHSPQVALLRAGIARCGYCGYTMSVQNRGSIHQNQVYYSYPYYCCGHGSKVGLSCPGGRTFAVGATPLDTEFWACYIQPLLKYPAAIQEAVAFRTTHQETELTRLQMRQETVHDNLAELEMQQENLLDTIARTASEVARTALAQRLELLVAEVDAVKARQVTLANARLDAERQASAWDRVTANITRYCSDVDSLSYDDKRALLYALGVRVYCFRRGDTAAYEAFSVNVRGLGFELEPSTAGYLYRVLFFTEDAARAAGVPVDSEYSMAAKAALAEVFKAAMSNIEKTTSACYFVNCLFPVLSWGELMRHLVVA